MICLMASPFLVKQGGGGVSTDSERTYSSKYWRHAIFIRSVEGSAILDEEFCQVLMTIRHYKNIL